MGVLGAQNKIIPGGSPNMAMVTVEPGVLAVIITILLITPVIKQVTASLFLHEDSHHKVAQNWWF